MPKTRFRSITLCRHYPLAFILLTALLLTPALAQAFGLGKVSALFGIEPGSRLAKPYAVLKEQEFPYSQSFYPTSVAWSADGRYIADTGILTPLIHVWSVRRRAVVRILDAQGTGPGYHALAWSPDERYLAACTNGRTTIARVWDTRTWAVARIVPRSQLYSGCESVAFSPRGHYLAVAMISLPANIRLYRTSTWKRMKAPNFRRLPRVGPTGFGFDILQIAFRPHAKELAIGVQGYFPGDRNAHARVIFWHLDGPPLDLRHAPPGSVLLAYRRGAFESLAYNPAGTQLATGPDSGAGSAYFHNLVTDSARVWDASSHALLGAPLDGHDIAGEINGLAYTADGRYLLVGHTSPRGADRLHRHAYLQGRRHPGRRQFHRRARRRPAGADVRCHRRPPAAHLVDPVSEISRETSNPFLLMES